MAYVLPYALARSSKEVLLMSRVLPAEKREQPHSIPTIRLHVSLVCYPPPPPLRDIPSVTMR